jgi:hypothetical protein
VWPTGKHTWQTSRKQANNSFEDTTCVTSLFLDQEQSTKKQLLMEYNLTLTKVLETIRSLGTTIKDAQNSMY